MLDANVRGNRATGGGILRDCDGKMVGAFYKEFGESDVLIAESFAVLFAIYLCIREGWKMFYLKLI